MCLKFGVPVTVSPKEKARHAMHRTAQMAGNEPFGKMNSALRNNFAGGRIRKTETTVFKIRRGLGFRPAGGRGRNAGRVSDFSEGDSF